MISCAHQAIGTLTSKAAADLGLSRDVLVAPGGSPPPPAAPSLDLVLGAVPLHSSTPCTERGRLIAGLPQARIPTCMPVPAR